jgi:hypothetical protein
MTAMSRQASLYNENERDFEGSSVGFLVDSGCIALSGLCFGCSPCTPFVGKSLPRTFSVIANGSQKVPVVSRKVERRVSQQSQPRSGLDYSREYDDELGGGYQLGLLRGLDTRFRLSRSDPLYL